MLLFVHCDEQRRWQVDALRRSIAVAGQDGTLVVREDRHPERDRYAILDRVLAFQKCMMEYRGDEPVAIMDPDMVVLRRLVPNVERGWGQATLHLPHMALGAKRARQLEFAVPGCTQMQHLDLPWVLSAQDARLLAPRWLDLTQRMVDDRSVCSLFGWALDMWAYCAVAYGMGVTHDVSVPLACVPGYNPKVRDAWVLHYYDAVYGFSKRTYRPGDELPPCPEHEPNGPYSALRAALS
jgi:hypothetical protein